MKVEGRYTFPVPQGRVWALIMDPHALSRCVPGCEKLEQIGLNRYEATLKIGVASVKGTYTGRVEIRDPEPPTRYRMVVEGSGSPGFIRGEGELALSEAEGQTTLTVRGEAQVGGLIAGVGQRMLGGIAKLLLDQFFKGVGEELARAAPPGSTATGA